MKERKRDRERREGNKNRIIDRLIDIQTERLIDR